MSLSSLLLAAAPDKIDADLDALFKSNPAPRPAPKATTSAPPPRKRKPEAPLQTPPDKKQKRSKPEPVHASSSKPKSTKKPNRVEPVVDVDSEEEDDDDDNESDADDNSDLENAYLNKTLSKKPGAPSTNAAEEESQSEADANSEGEEDEEDSDPDAPPPVHESLTKRVRTKPTKKAKVVPDNETSAQRDSRTLFVGGLPLEVAQKKSLRKQLSRHILSFLPSSSRVKIESIRFRSVAFRDPTSSASLSTPSSSTPSSLPKNISANSVPVAGSNHATTRASTWRQKDNPENDNAEGETKKEFLTPAQKKKIMFIQGNFHPEASSVTAYVVLAHPSPPSNDNEGEAEEDDTPYTAALHIARAANASQFMERTLRVDLCGRLPDAADASGLNGVDAKLSVFVGNLDFGSTESDVREFFEGVVAGERGPANDDNGRWVQNVRLIRDRETQLGKGFGYIRFLDRECVDEVLALTKTDEGKKKLRFAKRTLRVQRCRASASSSSPVKSDTKSTGKTTPSKSSYPPTPAAKGDPALGARIAHLDKDARKAAKKADRERVLRRAEKKKKGMRMRVKSSDEKVGLKSEGGRTRKRPHKSGGGGKVGGGGGGQAKVKAKPKPSGRK
ncbi:RRM domain-containing protein [Favolaschia claudopus]|uniref:Nucleolar protein 12 n=1 Tax=Favolaschia claudopus TaxID=2862362 RepID=A0AAW0E2A1_9AGAR